MSADLALKESRGAREAMPDRRRQRMQMLPGCLDAGAADLCFVGAGLYTNLYDRVLFDPDREKDEG